MTDTLSICAGGLSLLALLASLYVYAKVKTLESDPIFACLSDWDEDD